jgi:inosose dehydratase
MSTGLDRRDFLAGAAMAGAGLALFGRDLLAADANIRVGCAAITWDGDDQKAIDDIASIGFPGIQLRTSTLKLFAGRPGALRDLLRQRGLTFVAFSSGNLRLDPAFEREDQETHARHAAFVRDAGGLYLQIIDERPRGRAIATEDFVRLGRLLTDLGRRTADIGVPLVYHHHMNSLGERPDEIRRILDAADPRYVKLLLDLAHYQQGGGDPVQAIEDYHDRLALLHIKDVESPVPGATGDLSRSYRFVELGRGRVNLKAAFAALSHVGFDGWAVIELDRVTDQATSPREANAASKAYLEREIGLRVGRAGVAAAPAAAAGATGWIALFDGTSLDAWRGYRKPDASGTRWKIEDGLLTVQPGDGADTKGALDLISRQTFTRFELAFEWKIAPAGNSGVKYFVLEDTDAAIGHEYQILDDERHPDGKIGAHRQTAALYDVLPAGDRPLKPAGEFNHSRIVADGKSVEHWLNGARVLRYELGSSGLKSAIVRSKFKDVARFGTLQDGHILLQDHGDRVWYRNIQIRRLTSHSSPQGAAHVSAVPFTA